MTFSARDLHLQVYKRRPAETELYYLLKKWNFYLIHNDIETVQAGLDKKSWLEILGFVPDEGKLIESK
jgi:hypothetical protein